MLLNPRQQEAVEHQHGPLLIVAGAGAGKTRVLTYRIKRLIEKGVHPSTILAITFTNKAAKEMRERVLSLLSDPHMPSPFVSTFHALGVRMLREFGEVVGIKRSFVILDRSDSLRRIKRALKDEGFDPQRHKPERILGTISKAKGDAVTAEVFAEEIDNPWKEITAVVWKRYEDAARAEHALDFDDLLLLPVELLRKNSDIQKEFHRRFQYVHVDEYQDTNRVQYELTRLLVNPEHNNLCVVGDGDQTIYTWRGAHLRHMLEFEDSFPGASTVLLEENYRSTQTILDAANSVISKNVERVPKKLFTSNTEGGKIHILQSWNEQGEASRVLDEVETLLASHVPADEIAILYRANYQSRVLEEACLNRGISYQLLGTRFYERKEVKDMISYLRAALNPDSWEDIARIINTPKRGIGAKTLEKVRLGEQETLSPRLKKEVDDFYTLLANIRRVIEKEPLSKALGYILNESGLKADLENDGEEGLERLENISELISLASLYDEYEGLTGAEEFLAQAALATDQDDLSEDTGGIKLMTVHASKGLEFDAVFVTGLEEGLFPQERDDESSDREEERRLMYVAITRARHHLFLSWARSRRIFGSEQFRLPSQFLSDIDPELCEGDIPQEEPEFEDRRIEFLDLSDL